MLVFITVQIDGKHYAITNATIYAYRGRHTRPHPIPCCSSLRKIYSTGVKEKRQQKRFQLRWSHLLLSFLSFCDSKKRAFHPSRLIPLRIISHPFLLFMVPDFRKAEDIIRDAIPTPVSGCDGFPFRSAPCVYTYNTTWFQYYCRKLSKRRWMTE